MYENKDEDDMSIYKKKTANPNVEIISHLKLIREKQVDQQENNHSVSHQSCADLRWYVRRPMLNQFVVDHVVQLDNYEFDWISIDPMLRSLY